MLKSIIISPDADILDQIGSRLAEMGGVTIVRTLHEYPSELELVPMLRAHAPQLVFLAMSGIEHATEVLRMVEQNAPGIQVVGLHRALDPQVMLEAMRVGIREFIAQPFEAGELGELLIRVEENLTRRPVSLESTDLLYTFLPAKPGVGATTVALNAAVAVSRIDATKTLLADFDLNCGLVQFMLKLGNPHSVVDAADYSDSIDEEMWPQMVTSIGNLDVMHAGKLNPQHRIEPGKLRHLLEFMRRNYRAICVDVSGNFERYSIDLMQESKLVFLVCTPELTSLHLAREKIQFLEDLKLGKRIRVLLNRSHRAMLISPSQIEQLLGRELHMIFVNDYAGVHKAVAEGQPVAPTCNLGQQFTALAHSMLELTPSTPQKRRFVEYFAVSASRYSFGRKRD